MDQDVGCFSVGGHSRHLWSLLVQPALDGQGEHPPDLAVLLRQADAPIVLKFALSVCV